MNFQLFRGDVDMYASNAGIPFKLSPKKVYSNFIDAQWTPFMMEIE